MRSTRRAFGSRGLFVRLFAGFWVAMLVIGAGTFAIFELSGPPPRWAKRRALFDDALRLQGEIALQAYESEGPEAAAETLRDLDRRTGIALAVIQPDESGEERVLAGEVDGDPLELARRLRLEGQTPNDRSSLEIDEGGRAMLLIDLPGGAYAVSTRHRSSALDRFVGPNLPARLAVMALVAGLLAFFLARWLARPLGRLRRATREIAEGRLDVRVASRVRGGPQEIEALAADFDRMAARIESLVASQQRMIRDVSHELRSPLARLHVALELARQNTSNDDATTHLDRIELEAERLGELIGQILTLSKLEGGLPSEGPVDLEALVEEVVGDASYEADAKGRSVDWQRGEVRPLRGSADVLRWAIENVLRNALRFTPEDSSVEVRTESLEGDRVAITIRDHGPGVPEHQLEAIFRPFFRIGTDRDRRTGGRGVGLAIAERAVLAHRGSIRAENETTGGLRVTIELPAAGEAESEPPSDSRELT